MVIGLLKYSSSFAVMKVFCFITKISLITDSSNTLSDILVFPSVYPPSLTNVLLHFV